MQPRPLDVMEAAGKLKEYTREAVNDGGLPHAEAMLINQARAGSDVR
ncbi:MAG: hypothetical protein ACREXW_08550 [Gammaproteobacteria bacterium]